MPSMDRDGRYTVDGDALRTRRLARGWTVRELALYAGTSHDAVIDLEYGRRRPRKALVQKLAGAFGVDEWELLAVRDSQGDEDAGGR